MSEDAAIDGPAGKPGVAREDKFARRGRLVLRWFLLALGVTHLWLAAIVGYNYLTLPAPGSEPQALAPLDQLRAGQAAFDAGHFEVAWAALRPLAEAGDPQAEYLVGRLYQAGTLLGRAMSQRQPTWPPPIATATASAAIAARPIAGRSTRAPNGHGASSESIASRITPPNSTPPNGPRSRAGCPAGAPSRRRQPGSFRFGISRSSAPSVTSISASIPAGTASSMSCPIEEAARRRRP